MKNKLQFGTDGVRGPADAFPFTTDALIIFGQAIAKWSIEKYKTKNPCVLLGHDTRESCDRIKKDLSTGLSSHNLKIIDGEILPTPAVLQIINHDEQFTFGIVISASHNKYTDNGIKIFDSKSGKLSSEDEKIITDNFKILSEKDTKAKENKNKNDIKKNKDKSKYKNKYVKNILSYFKPGLLKEKTVILDCANGATSFVAPEIFSALGATIIPLHINPDGKNINKDCGTMHPQILQAKVLEYSADIGFAFDGDGDRILAINKNGELRDGDDILAILLQHPEYKDQKEIAGTVMTNYGFEQDLEKNNIKLTRTNVGDKYIVTHLEKNNLMLGGEASGHIIIRSYLNTGDGIFVALKIIESILATENWDIKTFTKTPQILINGEVTNKKNLDQEPYKTIIDNYKKELINGRIVVRYSGTENLLRVMVEDQTIDSATKIAQSLSTKLQKSLSK